MRDYEELVSVLRDLSEDTGDECAEAAEAIEELKQNIEQYKLYLQDTINDLCSAHEKEPKWISVEDRLPDVNERVLACVSVFGEPSVWDAVRWNGKEWEAEKEAAYEYWTSIDFPVTHWMPLPEPPKGDADA